MPRKTRQILATLVVALLSLSLAASAQAGQRSFSVVKVGKTSVSFRIGGVAPKRISAAKVNFGSISRGVPVQRVRRAAARRSLVSVRVPRKAARAAANHSLARAARRRRPKLVVTTDPAPTTEPAPTTDPAAGTLTGRVAGFESSDYSEVTWSSATSSTTLDFTTERAYEGTHALKIAYDGALGNRDAGVYSFARVWYGVDWSKGSDVWYGSAFYVPDPSKLRYTDLIRWDNHLTYGSAGDTGGVIAENGRMRIQKRSYDGTGSAALTPEVAIPAGRWFWVEVHQKLSDVPGEALSELYLDGVKVGSSTAPNSLGRTINHIRYGYVNHWSGAAEASTLYMDRASISNAPRGPLS